MIIKKICTVLGCANLFYVPNLSYLLCYIVNTNFERGYPNERKKSY